MSATCARLAELGGILQPGEVAMEIDDSKSFPANGGLTLELTRKLRTQHSRLNRYLIELPHQESWAAGIRHLLDAPDIPQRPWPASRMST